MKKTIKKQRSKTDTGGKGPAQKQSEARTTAARKSDTAAAAAAPDPHGVVLDGGMAQNLGVQIISIAKKRIVAEMAVDTKHMNRSGRVNGGALMAFADLVGATGTVANLPPGYRTTTLESKTNFFAAGDGPVLKAVSKPLHIGRTTMVWQTTIRNADHKLVAIVTQTQMVLPGKRE
jgi:1,4-dihydroxy-2-naphthoyl-CoA hydrolase